MFGKLVFAFLEVTDFRRQDRVNVPDMGTRRPFMETWRKVEMGFGDTFHISAGNRVEEGIE